MILSIEISADTEAQLREMARNWATNEALEQRLPQTLAIEAKMHLHRGVREAYGDWKRHEARQARIADEVKTAVEEMREPEPKV